MYAKIDVEKFRCDSKWFSLNELENESSCFINGSRRDLKGKEEQNINPKEMRRLTRCLALSIVCRFRSVKIDPRHSASEPKTGLSLSTAVFSVFELHTQCSPIQKPTFCPLTSRVLLILSF